MDDFPIARIHQATENSGAVKRGKHQKRRDFRFGGTATAMVAASIIGVVSLSASSSSSMPIAHFAEAQPQPATQWSFNVSDASGPLNWGTILNTDGDVLYPSCFMDEFPAPRRFHDVHLKLASSVGEKELSPIRLDYLPSSHFKIEVKNRGASRPSLSVSLLDIQCTTWHPQDGTAMALQRIEFLIPAENEMGYVNGLEVHLVHAELDATNTPIPPTVKPEFILATFYDGVITGGTPEISKILHYAPKSGSGGSIEITGVSLDASLLFPAKHDYIFFKGVVPQPPCNTQAHYALFVQNLYFSTAQMQLLREILFGPTFAADSNQRNSAIVTVRNKAALTLNRAEYIYFVAVKHAFPLVLPPKNDPMFAETRLAIAGFCFGAMSALSGLIALVFSLCRPRTRLSKKDEMAAAAGLKATPIPENADANLLNGGAVSTEENGNNNNAVQAFASPNK